MSAGNDRCEHTWPVDWHERRCKYKGVVTEDGKRWCRIHAPSKAQARRDANDRKSAKRQAWQREHGQLQASLAFALDRVLDELLTWEASRNVMSFYRVLEFATAYRISKDALTTHESTDSGDAP